MAGPDVITTTAHVVDNGVGINANSGLATGLNHVTELSAGSVARVKSIGDWLVVEPPGVQLSVLRPCIREYRLLRREHLDSHPTHFAKSSALVLNVSPRPSEHFDDSTLLALLIGISLRDVFSLPDEVEGLHGVLPFLSITIDTLDKDGEVLAGE
jgi:hypothetical protein